MKKKTKKTRRKASTALARREPDPLPDDGGILSTFGRLSRDKSIDAGKLEKLVVLQQHIMRVNAEAAFNRAFIAMVLEIPEIDRRGRIKNKQGEVQSTYSRHEDIQRIVKPILQRFGFSLSYSSEWPSPVIVKVIGILTHAEGHARRSEFMSPADESGNKNKIQGLGSAVAYGRRYTTIDLLNITTKEDNDGQGGGRGVQSDARAHYDAGGDEKITQKQRQRLAMIAKDTNRPGHEVAMWLKVRWGLDSSADIKRRDYEYICKALEHPGPLPLEAGY